MSVSWLEPNPPSPPPWINGAVIMKFKFFAARNLRRLLNFDGQVLLVELDNLGFWETAHLPIS